MPVLATCALLIAGCGGGAPKATSGLNNSGSSSTVASASDNRRDIDLGQDWDRPAQQNRLGSRQGTGGSQAPISPDQPFWTIVLNTFSGENHARAAQNMAAEVGRVTPALAGARVHSTANGSMVIYGMYGSAEDSRAERDLKIVKEQNVQGRPVYPRALLTRITPNVGRGGPLHPNDLRSARRLHPNVDPLYTLQVAVWSDFGSGEISAEEVRRRAEQYAAEQRARGVDAYFHHDTNERTSIVTVGLFGRSAIQTETGLFGPEVQRYLRQYPQHLVNGEPLIEPVNRMRPELGTEVQKPRLVVVPR